MARTPLTDESVEALIAGRSDEVPDDLAGLATVLRAVRTSAAPPSVPSADLVDLFADGAEPQPEPAVADERSSIGLRRRWLEAAFQRAATLGVAAKLGLVAVVGVAGVTGVGAAGALPDGLQDRVADAVETYTPFNFPASAGNEATSEVGQPVAEDATDAESPGVEGPSIADELTPPELTPRDLSPVEPAAPVTPAHPDRGLDRAETRAEEHVPEDADDAAAHDGAAEDPPGEQESGDEHDDGTPTDQQFGDDHRDGYDEAEAGHDDGDVDSGDADGDPYFGAARDAFPRS